MSKYKWIAQDSNGEVYRFYEKEPEPFGKTWINGNCWKSLYKGSSNPNWQDTLINLETEDYEVVDGILKRLPRKTELDKLIQRVKLIDRRAAKWINKNRHKCADIDDIRDAMPDWGNCKYGYDYWCDIANRLDFPIKPKKTIRYRVSLHKDNGHSYFHMSIDEEDEEVYENSSSFVEWKTDWIEVEVNDE